MGADFFISYNSADRAWAEWIAWQLEAGGWTTTLQAWDFTPGRDWVHAMHSAMHTARRTIAVVSPDYLRSEHGEAEWRGAYARDPTGGEGILVPVRVAPSDLPGLLATRVAVDLVGLDEAEARDALLEGLKAGRAKPSQEPAFPARTPPGFPPVSSDDASGGRSPGGRPEGAGARRPDDDRHPTDDAPRGIPTPDAPSGHGVVVGGDLTGSTVVVGDHNVVRSVGRRSIAPVEDDDPEEP